MADKDWKDDTNRDEVKGCQAEICQGVLAYSLIFKRNASHCILVCCICWNVSGYVCAFERLIGGPHENVGDKPTIFLPSCEPCCSS